MENWNTLEVAGWYILEGGMALLALWFLLQIKEPPTLLVGSSTRLPMLN